MHTRHLREFSQNDIHFFQSIVNLTAASIDRLNVEPRILSSETELRARNNSKKN
jgi:GAF domain-containing protein